MNVISVAVEGLAGPVDTTRFGTTRFVLFQEASGYSKTDMTRLVWNAFRAIWLPETEQDLYVSQLREYASMNGVNWSDVTGGSTAD